MRSFHLSLGKGHRFQKVEKKVVLRHICKNGQHGARLMSDVKNLVTIFTAAMNQPLQSLRFVFQAIVAVRVPNQCPARKQSVRKL